MRHDVGIDDLGLWASSLSMDLAAVAAARGLPAGQLAEVGFLRRSICPAWEDPVTLAVNAALPLVSSPAERGAVGLLLVGTETGLDGGKPLSTWVHRHLSLPSSCRNFEVKHACYSGTAALLTAAGWVRENPDRTALVVMTDVPRIHHDAAELTAGVGAVALRISAQPRLLALETASGVATREVRDVTRPTPTTEQTDALLSLYSYLDLVEAAWEDLARRSGTAQILGHFDHLLFHAPLVDLVRRAHEALLLAAHPALDDDAIAAHFAQVTAPSLVLNRQTANLYSGSLYASLAGALSAATPGQRIGLFSYGSGACAELFSGIVAEGAAAHLARRAIPAALAARAPVDLATYDRLRQHALEALVAPDLRPDRSGDHWQAAWAGQGRLTLAEVVQHERRYAWS